MATIGFFIFQFMRGRNARVAYDQQLRTIELMTKRYIDDTFSSLRIGGGKNGNIFLKRTDFMEDSIKEIGAGHFGCVYRLKLKTKSNEMIVKEFK